MTSVYNSGFGAGSSGVPQNSLTEQTYPNKVGLNEGDGAKPQPPKYVPIKKHDKGGYGSKNPIKSQEEGQKLLDTGYKDGDSKQVYNVTSDGVIVKFQPDNTPDNGYHAYEVSKPRDVPAGILKQMLKDGKITQSEYNKYRKGKK